MQKSKEWTDLKNIFVFITTVATNDIIIWEVTFCNIVENYLGFWGEYCAHHDWTITLFNFAMRSLSINQAIRCSTSLYRLKNITSKEIILFTQKNTIRQRVSPIFAALPWTFECFKWVSSKRFSKFHYSNCSNLTGNLYLAKFLDQSCPRRL
jgi:hypothetical protein